MSTKAPRMFPRTVLAAGVLMAMHSPVWAQTAPMLAPITVTSESPFAQQSRITADNPGLAPEADVAATLRLIPGVTASRMSGHGLDPIIRGQKDGRLNVQLDGAYIANACPNRMDPPASFGNLSSYDVVEVERGVHSVIHGAGGSGGSIRLERDTFARAAEAGVQGTVRAGANSNGLRGETSADVLFSNGQAYGRVIGAFAEGDNYDDGDGNAVPSAFKQRSGTVIAGYRADEHTGFELSWDRNLMDDTRYAGSGMDSIYDHASIYRFDGRLGDLAGPIDQARLQLSRANVKHLMDNFTLRDRQGGMDMEAPTSSHSTTARLTLSSEINNIALDYGLDFLRTEQDAIARMAGMPQPAFRQWPDAQSDQMGGFIEADWQLDEQNALRLGARVDRFATKVDTSLNRSIATRDDIPGEIRNAAQKTQKDTTVSLLARYTHQFNPTYHAFAGISRTAVAPDLTQRYGLRGGMGNARFIGNPALNPEFHNQLDIGIGGAHDRFNWEAGLFYDHASDFILQDRVDVAGDTVTGFRNISARLYGGEAELDYQITDWLTGFANIAFTRGQNRSDNRNLPQIPPVDGTLGLEADWGSWGGGARLRMADRARFIDTQSGLDTEKTSGYAVLDLYAEYQINQQFTASIGVDNLFDDTYANHVNRVYNGLYGDPTQRINEPGRTFWANVSAHF